MRAWRYERARKRALRARQGRRRRPAGWQRYAIGVVVGSLMAGCAWLGMQAPPAEAPARTAPFSSSERLSPGLSALTVSQAPTRAVKIQWRSPWLGETQVSYGLSPSLWPSRTDRWIEGNQIELSGLRPQTRYYFVVETRTPLGFARSAVCSFLTR